MKSRAVTTILRGLVAAVLFVGTLRCDNYARAEAIIDPMKHDIFVVTSQNFAGVIGKFRNDQVAALLFYSKDDKSKGLINGVYNTLAKNLKGQVKIAAISCNEYRAFCDEHKVETYPTIVVFPPNPIPSYHYNREVSLAALTSHLMNLIPDGGARVLDSLAKHDQLLSENPAVPKIILFSDKKKAPPLYNALINAFKDRMTFAFVESSTDALVKRYAITKFPTIVSVKGNPSKTDYYKGDVKFNPLHEWLNIRSETFVKGGGFSDETRAEDSRIWLVQKVPEVTRASHQDICFKKQGLCVIYLVAGTISDQEISMLEDLASRHASGDRGVNFRWMWMNMNAEPLWKEMFDINVFPAVVVFNPHKRLRWTSLGGEETGTPANIERLFEKIAGGDSRFTAVKGQQLPRFSERSESSTKEEL